jgi:hypothetical protein
MLSPSAKLRINSAKHLAFSRWFEDEILRLPLRMTLRHGLCMGEDVGGGEFRGRFPFMLKPVGPFLRFFSRINWSHERALGRTL